MRNNQRGGRRGFALVLALLTTSISLILMMAYISRVVGDYKFTGKIYTQTAALDLAEAGAERALWEINWGPNKAQFASTGYITGWTQTTDAAGNSTSTSNNNILKTGGTSLETVGYYDVTLIKDTHNTYDAATNRIYITATGYAPTRTGYDSRKKVKVVYELYALHNFSMGIGASGTAGISLGTQGKIDSYNSANGTYAATKQNSNGNISTNGPITFGTQAKVYGDAHPGAAYPFSSKPSNVSGAWGTLQAPLVIDPIPQSTLDANRLPTGNSNGNIIKGNSGDPSPLVGNALTLGTQKTVTLPGGTYYFSSITLGTQARMIVTGPSIIYVDGGNVTVGTQADLNINVGGATTFYIAGGNMTVSTQGDINNLGVPKNLMIYSTGNTISLTTQTDLYASIYAPNAAVNLTTQGDIFGAISCKSFISGTQAGVHFDMDLLNVPIFPGGSGTASGVNYWQEIQ